jgi:hypothetical protein
MLQITIFILNDVDFIENKFFAADGFGESLFNSPS